MDWHFAIPALAFLIVSTLVALLQTASPSDENPQSLIRMGLFLVPGTLAAALAWIGYRLIESRILGSGASIHFLLKGETTAGQRIVPWVGFVYFVAMVTGMFAHTTWDAISKRRGRTEPSLDKWLYFRPALVAPIIFIAVLKLVGGGSFDIEALLLSFQNGFFWQTVLSRH
jgi:hypothetical protein